MVTGRAEAVFAAGVVLMPLWGPSAVAVDRAVDLCAALLVLVVVDWSLAAAQGK